jgi:FKBP-type peptidyl-prolyl cis-trans isomerase SlpA
MTDTQVGPDTRVTLHFSLLLAGGAEIDSTRGRAPATFVVGDGTLPPGVEKRMLGLAAGSAARLEIPACDAFGEARAENVRFMQRAQFGAGVVPEPGLIVSFRAPDGELPGVIRSIEGELVVVDFNHPLAGRDLVFEVSILAVTPTGG